MEKYHFANKLGLSISKTSKIFLKKYKHTAPKLSADNHSLRWSQSSAWTCYRDTCDVPPIFMEAHKVIAHGI